MDEIKARDTYRKIIDTYGPVRPFANIVEAEQRHSEMLLPLFERYGIAAPEARDPARIPVPGSRCILFGTFRHLRSPVLDPGRHCDGTLDRQ